MSKKKVLIVTQEMSPFTDPSELADFTRTLPQFVQDKGMELRVLMPKFGTINERRHRLHEVVRLSGMNIIVDDDDYPLIIKVASMPEARIQVYFLDNDDFFRRKHVFQDEAGQAYEDNVDRMVFFCKGVLETVRKFGWAPDIVHCHGWMTSLIPAYLKTAYKTEPLFQHAKVVYSLYNDELEEKMPENFFLKAAINNLNAQDLDAYQNGDGITLHKGAIAFADGVVIGSPSLSDTAQATLANTDKPVLEFSEDAALPGIVEFYNSLMAEEVAAQD
jgi:starch synthase